MSQEQTPWWELPGAPGENRTKEQYDAMVRSAKEPNPSRSPSYLLGAAESERDRFKEALQTIVANKDNKNWRKPELIYIAQRALGETS